MKNLTKKQKIEIVKAYEQSNLTDIYEAYKNPSHYKVCAFMWCEELMKKYGGFDLRIIGYNCMQFSAGFQYEDKNTEVVMFAYITKEYNRFFEYPVY